jgi:hypothetical protein
MSTLVKTLRTIARGLLTLFVLGQFVFLVSANFLGVEEPLRKWFKDWHWKDRNPEADPVPDYFEGKGPVHEKYYDKSRTYAKHWSQLTGQPQNWSLFAPYILEVVPFPAVELRWDDQDWPDWADWADWAERPLLPGQRPAPVVVLSDNEPLDPHAFAHFSGFRFRKYEGNLTPYASAEDGSFDPETSGWRKKIGDRVDDEPACMRNYLRWRLQVYQEANRGLPRPTQVILLVRAYKVPKPPGPDPWDWYDLGEDRVARWLPSAPLDTQKYEPVERYDPVEHHFERVGK